MVALGDLAPDMVRVGSEAQRVRRQLEAGQDVDLEALEAAVVRLRMTASDLQPDRLLAYRPTMLALLADLDALYGAIRTAHAESRAGLDGLGARRRALSAYARPKR